MSSRQPDTNNTSPLDQTKSTTNIRWGKLILFFIPASIFFMAGITLLLASLNPVVSSAFLHSFDGINHNLFSSGIALFLAAYGISYFAYSKIFEEKPTEFIDIDKQKDNRPRGGSFSISASKMFQSPQEPSFNSYFLKIDDYFSSQIELSDKKASLLLDRGTKYSRNGIYFYAGSIILWQLFILSTGFHPHYIYGIAGCSMIFIFIEFLSAWFLKQYRHYVDTSTYLIKIKTILEKYFLMYLSIKEAQKNNKDFSELQEALKADIKWPDTFLTKHPDVGFAKECLDTATQFVSAVKSEVAPEAKKEKKPSGILHTLIDAVKPNRPNSRPNKGQTDC